MLSAATKEYLRNSWLMVFLFQTKKQLQFHHQFKHHHQKLTRRQPTNFGMKYQSFILIARVTSSLQSNLNSVQLKSHVLIKLTICATLSSTAVTLAFSQRSMYFCAKCSGNWYTFLLKSLCLFTLGFTPRDIFDGERL
jgi:hypothetical protein